MTEFTRPRRSLMVKDLCPGLPERGKIKIGVKGKEITSQQGNKFQPPQKLDHFVVTTTERGPDGNFKRDEALHVKIGDRPTSIPIYLPFHDIELNLQTRYACFSGRKMWCSGDGESAQRLTDDGHRVQVSCVCERIDPDYAGRDKCKLNGLLSVMIRDAGGVGGVWKFRTTSFNTVTGLMSTLALIKATTGGPLAGIPLTMRISPKTVASPTDGRIQTIYVVSVGYDGSMEELRDQGYQLALAQAKTNYSIEHIEEQARRMLAPPDAPLPGDDVEDIGAEFYPDGMEIHAPTRTPEQVEAEAIVAEAEAEIEEEMKSESPPAEGPAPGLESGGAPAVPASTTTGGSARTDGRTRRGATKQSAAPPATPAAAPAPSGEKGAPMTAPPGGGGTSPAKEPRPATDEQIGRIEAAFRDMTPGTSAAFITWAKEMFGAIGDNYLKYTYDEAVVAEGWIEDKREAAKAARASK